MKFFDLLPAIAFLAIGIFLYIFSGFNNKLLLPLVVFISLGVYTTVYTFQEKMSSWVQNKMKLDEKLQQLIKEDASLLWAYVSGMGVAFLIPGLTPSSGGNIVFLLGAMIFFIIGEFVYALHYLPRQQWLVRKRLIDLEMGRKQQ